MGIRKMSHFHSLLQHHFKRGLVLGKKEGRGWKWPGSTGFPFSEFPSEVPSGEQFPKLEPAQRPWAAQLILGRPLTWKGALAARGTATLEFCSSPVRGRCYLETSPPISMCSQTSTLLHPRYPPKNSSCPAPSSSLSSKDHPNSLGRLSPPHLSLPLGADSTGTAPGSACSPSAAP